MIPRAQRLHAALELCKAHAGPDGLVRLTDFAAEARAARVYHFQLKKLAELGFLVRANGRPGDLRTAYRLNKKAPPLASLDAVPPMTGEYVRKAG